MSLASQTVTAQSHVTKLVPLPFIPIAEGKYFDPTNGQRIDRLQPKRVIHATAIKRIDPKTGFVVKLFPAPAGDWLAVSGRHKLIGPTQDSAYNRILVVRSANRHDIDMPKCRRLNPAKNTRVMQQRIVTGSRGDGLPVWDYDTRQK